MIVEYIYRHNHLHAFNVGMLLKSPFFSNFNNFFFHSDVLFTVPLSPAPQLIVVAEFRAFIAR